MISEGVAEIEPLEEWWREEGLVLGTLVSGAGRSPWPKSSQAHFLGEDKCQGEKE